MSGMQTNTTEHLIRSQLWSSELKEVLEDELIGMRYVRMIDFPDGNTLNIPSIGQAQSYDYAEGQQIKYNALETGNFQFSIAEYKASGIHISNKLKQDSYVMSQIVSSFVPTQARAIAKAMESKILSIGPDTQTASNTNTINGAYHRWVSKGTNQVIEVEDFAKALYALQKANVPTDNLVAIVDPSVEYHINTITNLTNISNNPRWEGIVADGISTGMKFVKNIYGFDVYVSQNLKSGISETIDSTTASAGVANLFFSATPGQTMPIIGGVRQAPTVDSSYNKDFQRDEYVTTARYDFALFRPENFVVCITDTDQVYA